jgi:hypothetical protein
MRPIPRCAVHDVLAGRDEPAPLGSVSAVIPPYDCAMYVLRLAHRKAKSQEGVRDEVTER